MEAREFSSLPQHYRKLTSTKSESSSDAAGKRKFLSLSLAHVPQTVRSGGEKKLSETETSVIRETLNDVIRKILFGASPRVKRREEKIENCS